MTAYGILRHAILMVANNLNDVLRLSAPLIIASVLIQLVSTLFGGVSIMEIDPDVVVEEQDFGGLGWIVGLSIAQLVITFWVLVAWHRYVLLEERPDSFWLPVPADRVFAYIGTFLLIALVGIGIGLVFFAAIAMLGQMFGGGGLGLIVVGLIAVLFMWLYAVLIRISVALPAAAIGEPIGVVGAWRATDGQTTLCAKIAFLGVILSVVATLPMLLLGLVLPGPLFAIASGIFNVLISIVAASVLTTLYGVFVENRNLM